MPSEYHLYWGDIHSHCGISYGEGELTHALEAAREHLDFCSVTGHACWPDMPTDREQYARVIDQHSRGFAKLRRLWPEVLQTFEDYYQPGQFVTFLSYEWHSCEFGDHTILLFEPKGEITDAPTLGELREKLSDRRAIVFPHHIGYKQGYRGINWDAFDDSLSPFVEIYSLHGCSESDNAPYPMQHTMGPRDHQSTAAYGLSLGHKFGLVANTDHHGGYPGSYGEGRTAVFAGELTREGIWEALSARRVYAVTGDKIKAWFRVNDAWPGEETEGVGPREISLTVEANDFVDHIELIKNNRVLYRFDGRLPMPAFPGAGEVRAKVRVEYGWGPRDLETDWNLRASVTDGRIASVEPCFRGRSVILPEESDAGSGRMANRIVAVDETSCAWTSHTRGNPSVWQSATNAMILEVEMPTAAELVLEANGRTFTHPLSDLLEGSRVHVLRGWLTEAVRIHRAVPASAYCIDLSWTDQAVESEADFYYVRIAQRNNQWAWLSPIWVQR